jgi:adenylate cyclase
VLATADIADAAASLDIDTTALGPFILRNVAETVDLWDLALVAPPSAGSVDPVCRMHVDHARSVGHLHFEGREFWFCSLECAASFASEPRQFAQ